MLNCIHIDQINKISKEMEGNSTYNFTALNLSMLEDSEKDSAPRTLNCYEGAYFVRLVADVWISFPMAVLGILGNIVAFIVLCCYRQKLSTTIVLQALAIVDTLILVSVIPLRSLRITFDCFKIPRDYHEPWKVMFQWMYPTLFVLRMMDTWLITLLTFDRWIAVCKPLQAQHLCRLGATYKRIAVVVALSILFSFPRFLESREWGIPTHINPNWRENSLYVYIYRIALFFIFMYLIPTCLLIVLNVKLLLSLRINDPALINRRHSKHGTCLGSQSQHRSITVIVISVVVIYFICNILAITSQIIFSLEYAFKDLEDVLETHRRRISNVSNVFLTFNSASNFFIYCICSKNFRTVMYRTFRCRNKLNRFKFFRSASRTSYSNGTLDTSSSLLQGSNQISMGKYFRHSTTDTL